MYVNKSNFTDDTDFYTAEDAEVRREIKLDIE
jgi:hypothetical protein